ncbi:MAG: GAF domain-containing protein [Erysipelotrichaceae bacterium]|nr:GAF domain-containing protein [Erysipelotrichaceae bacterium]
MQDYQLLLEQAKTHIDNTLPFYTVLSNISAVLNQLDDINWAGFYLVKDDTLYLGPFQGEVACTVIKKGKGVCGTSFQKEETIIVPDVNKFPGHIACSSKSKSEIVTPIFKESKVIGVIDIDAPIYDRFHEEEKILLEEIAKLLSSINY